MGHKNEDFRALQGRVNQQIQHDMRVFAKELSVIKDVLRMLILRTTPVGVNPAGPVAESKAALEAIGFTVNVQQTSQAPNEQSEEPKNDASPSAEEPVRTSSGEPQTQQDSDSGGSPGA